MEKSKLALLVTICFFLISGGKAHASTTTFTCTVSGGGVFSACTGTTVTGATTYNYHAYYGSYGDTSLDFSPGSATGVSNPKPADYMNGWNWEYFAINSGVWGGPLGDGQYWTRFESPTGSSDFQDACFVRSGGVWSAGGCTPADTSTRIITTTPKNNEVVSTTTTVGFTAYINTDEWVDGTYARFTFTNNTVVNSPGGSALDAWCAAFQTCSSGGQAEIEIPMTSGNNTIATTTSFPLIGDVTATWQIKIPNTTPIIGFLFPDQTLVASSTTFTVQQKTALDIAMSSTSELLIEALVTGTTTPQSIIRCNPGNFDIQICLISLIIPPQSVLLSDFNQLKDGFFEKWPMGYITRMVTILGASTTGSIPVVDATVPPGIPGAGSRIVLDANGVLDQFLYATSGPFISGSATSTETLYDITSYYWNRAIYLLLALYILRRILGSHLIGGEAHSEWSGTKSEQERKQRLFEDSITDRLGPGKRKR